jgi:hypothetical protein
VFGRVYEQLIFSIGFLPHANTWLLLVREAFAEEISAPCFLQGIVRLDRQKLSNALADTLSPWEMSQAGTRERSLFFNPLSRARRVLFFEPAVGVYNGHPVENLGDRLNRGKRRSQS